MYFSYGQQNRSNFCPIFVIFNKHNGLFLVSYNFNIAIHLYVCIVTAIYFLSWPKFKCIIKITAKCVEGSHMTDSPDKSKNLKEEILEVTGRLFLQYGYSGTTFQQIADELGITKGAITYHFKNKFLIMEIFIDDYFRMLKDFIDSYPEEYKNKYWRHCVVYIYAYRQIMKTPRSIELFYHKDQQAQWQSHKIEIVSHIYEQIEKDFHKSYKMEDLRIKAYIDMGARSRLFDVYQNNPGVLTLDQYCYYHIYLLGSLCKLDEMTIQENIAAAFQFADSHEPPVHAIFKDGE